MGLHRWQQSTLVQVTTCPVTGGRQTRLTADGFRRLCAHRRDYDSERCRSCEGRKMPEELEIITMDEQHNMEDAMTTRNSWEGVCYLCGEKKTVRRVKDEKLCCGTCEHIYRNAVNNPGLLVEALKKGQGEDYISQHPGADVCDQSHTHAEAVLEQIRAKHNIDPGADIEEFVNNLVGDVAYLKNRLHATKQIIATIRGQLDIDEGQPIIEALALLQRERQEAVDACNETVAIIGNPFRGFAIIPTAVKGLMAMRDEWNNLVNRMGQIRAALHAELDADLVQQAEVVNHLALLFNQVEAVLGIDGQDSEEAPQLIAEMLVREKQLLQMIADLEAIVDNDPFPETTLEWTSPDNRTAALLDIALDVIAGRVSGLDADRIAALR